MESLLIDMKHWQLDYHLYHNQLVENSADWISIITSDREECDSHQITNLTHISIPQQQQVPTLISAGMVGVAVIQEIIEFAII